MQIQNNPWSFLNTDPATATITGATGLTLNADGTVTITTTGALTFNTGADSNLAFTVLGATAAAYNGFYNRISGASGATSFVMQPQFAIPSGTAQSGGGTLAQVLYRHKVRIEDISWQNIGTGAEAAGVSMQIVDRNGNDIWRAAIPATAPNLAQLNRGKVYWVAGLVPISIPANSQVLITVN
jgi:hypothetical protein